MPLNLKTICEPNVHFVFNHQWQLVKGTLSLCLYLSLKFCNRNIFWCFCIAILQHVSEGFRKTHLIRDINMLSCNHQWQLVKGTLSLCLYLSLKFCNRNIFWCFCIAILQHVSEGFRKTHLIRDINMLSCILSKYTCLTMSIHAIITTET